MATKGIKTRSKLDQGSIQCRLWDWRAGQPAGQNNLRTRRFYSV